MNGERLKLVREKLNLSQVAFGEHFGVSQNAISHYENDERDIPHDIIYMLNNDFAVNLNWFYTGYGDIFHNGVSDDSVKMFVENKRLIDGLLNDNHLQHMFSVLDTNPVLKDILYLLLKSYGSNSKDIDEYYKLLLNYIKSKK